MKESNKSKIPGDITNSLGGAGISRLDFLKYASATGAAVATLGLISCSEDENPVSGGDMVNLGMGDTGILNYAYALEQLEAGFYVTVIDNPYAGMTSEEGALLEDIRDHEVAHADFYNAVLTAQNAAIPALTPTFEEAGIDFTSKASVLATALTFENVGVSAYNGAGALLTDGALLLVAGKIVSVEARHAAAISDLVYPSAGVTGQGGIIDGNGLDLARPPQDVLGIVQPFILETIDGSGLPQ